MLGKLKRRLTFANVTSLLALFFAVGGSAYAAVVVTSNGDVAPDTIAGHKPGAGQHSNLILGSVTNDDLASQTIKTGRIADGTLELRDLAADSVDGSKVQPFSIHRDDLDFDSVGGNQLVGTSFFKVLEVSSDDAVGGPATETELADFNGYKIIGLCNEATAGAVTATVFVRSTGISMAVDSTAQGGVNDATAIASGGTGTLASLGPTTGAHIASGAFGTFNHVDAPSGDFRGVMGTVSAGTHLFNRDCRYAINVMG